MPRRKYKNLSWKQRIPLSFAMLVLVFWSKGSSTWSVQPAGIYFNPRHITGVTIWERGHYLYNQFTPQTIEENQFYTHITGRESNRPVTVILVRHWIFGALMLVGLTWFALATPSYLRGRRREQAGQCLRCGYPLVGNTSGICSECGKPHSFTPFTLRNDGVAVAEGLTGVKGRDRYQLNLATTIDPEHPAEARIRLVNEAIIRWVRQRGSDCGRVVITFTTEPQLEKEILSWTMRIANQQIPEQEVLKAVPIEVVFRTSTGKFGKRMTLNPS